MVNQDPQPEIFESNHDFTTATLVNTSNINTIYTNQGFGEEVRIYALQVQILDADGRDISGTAMIDYDITIWAGPNAVPSNPFDASVIALMKDKTLSLSVPVVVGFKQVLRVEVTNRTVTDTGPTVTINVQLIGETGIIKVKC